MKIRVTQCSVGRYNFIGNEESLAFNMIIEDNEEKLVKLNDIPCILHYSGEPEERDDFDYYSKEDLSWIFDKCLKYANNVWGTTDYKAQCFAFYKIYKDNFEEIANQQEKTEKEKLEKLLKEIQSKLESNLRPENLTEYMEEHIKKEISKYQKWLSESELEKTKYKDGVEEIIKLDEKIEKYKNKIKELEEILN